MQIAGVDKGVGEASILIRGWRYSQLEIFFSRAIWKYMTKSLKKNVCPLTQQFHF